ncbi:MAG: threonine synthase [Candidatus Dormibacteria bacterium]
MSTVTAPSRIEGLVCRSCGTRTGIAATNVCDACFGPLEVRYDYTEIARRVSRASIAAGPPSIWRYRDLLPVQLEAGEEPVSLGEGFTPLVHARALGRRLGLRNLYLKNDTMNPTNSFKDRVVSVAITWAAQQGFTTVGCASTGNLANSVAAYAARAGLRAVVIIPADLEPAKVAATAAFKPVLVRVDGTYDDVNRLCSELADELGWAFCNINVRPFYAEGSKTLTFETAEQLGWRLPDEIVIPVASGCQFVKHRKAIDELRILGLVDPGGRTPRLTGAQAEGCSPVASAFRDGKTRCNPVRPQTIARSIAIGNPSDGAFVLEYARETGGTVAAVSDPEILDAIELLAETEGILAEPAGGTVVATLRKLAAAGRWQSDDTVVAYITGHGLKTMDALDGRAQLDGAIPPSLSAFRERYLKTPAGQSVPVQV